MVLLSDRTNASIHLPRPHSTPAEMLLDSSEAPLEGALPEDLAEAARGRQLAVAELDGSAADAARVDGQGVAHRHLGVAGRVEAHDEVVALGVAHLRPRDRPWQREHAPVSQRPDHAAAPEYRLP